MFFVLILVCRIVFCYIKRLIIYLMRIYFNLGINDIVIFFILISIVVKLFLMEEILLKIVSGYIFNYNLKFFYKLILFLFYI